MDEGSKYHSRFFVQVGHQTKHTPIGNDIMSSIDLTKLLPNFSKSFCSFSWKNIRLSTFYKEICLKNLIFKYFVNNFVISDDDMI